MLEAVLRTDINHEAHSHKYPPPTWIDLMGVDYHAHAHTHTITVSKRFHYFANNTLHRIVFGAVTVVVACKIEVTATAESIYVRDNILESH